MTRFEARVINSPGSPRLKSVLGGGASSVLVLTRTVGHPIFHFYHLLVCNFRTKHVTPSVSPSVKWG